jgi:hypothetical protein
LSHLAFLEGLPSGPADLIYTVLPSRSRECPGAAVILRGQEFLTGSFDWRWAIRHAEGHALFDRLHGIDADVRVIGAVPGGGGLGTREAGPGFSGAIRACAPEVQDIAPSLVPSPSNPQEVKRDS